MTDAESKAEGYVSSHHSRVKPDDILLQVKEKKNPLTWIVLSRVICEGNPLSTNPVQQHGIAYTWSVSYLAAV